MRTRVGRLTTGITLLLVGVCILLSEILEVAWVREWDRLWPLILIGYGIEYLLASRKEEKIAFDSVGAIIVGTVVIATSSFFSFGGFNFGIFGETYTFEDKPYETNAEGIDSLFLESCNGKIVIEPSNDEKIEIMATYKIRANSREEAEEIKTKYELKVDKKGDRLDARVDYPRVIFGFNFHPQLSVDLIVHAPKHLLVNADTSNGNIHVSSIERVGRLETSNGRITLYYSKGDAELDTSNGRIEVKNFVGNLQAETSNGSIILSNMNGNAELDTSNGKIEVTDFIGGLKAETSNSSVVAEGEVTGDWEISTTNGDIEITIPEEGSYDYDFNTSNGRVNAPNPPFTGKKKDHYVGEINGGRYELELDTSNADIEVNVK
jgi:DUF4097 and DUF4098 domain-containing protein YvlB